MTLCLAHLQFRCHCPASSPAPCRAPAAVQAHYNQRQRLCRIVRDQQASSRARGLPPYPLIETSCDEHFQPAELLPEPTGRHSRKTVHLSLSWRGNPCPAVVRLSFSQSYQPSSLGRSSPSDVAAPAQRRLPAPGVVPAPVGPVGQAVREVRAEAVDQGAAVVPAPRRAARRLLWLRQLRSHSRQRRPYRRPVRERARRAPSASLHPPMEPA